MRVDLLAGTAYIPCRHAGTRSDHSRLRFRARRPHGLRRGFEGAARRALSSMRRTMPGFRTGGFPRRPWSARVLAVMDRLIGAHAPDLVVIACNTASTLVLPHLRARYRGPVRRHGPGDQAGGAGRPDRADHRSRHARAPWRATIPATSSRPTPPDARQPRRLAPPCRLRRGGACRRAGRGRGHPREIAPCFVEEGGARTDVVMLACTHYPLLLARASARSRPGRSPGSTRRRRSPGASSSSSARRSRATRPTIRRPWRS